jgi:hypothetical protein
VPQQQHESTHISGPASALESVGVLFEFEFRFLKIPRRGSAVVLGSQGKDLVYQGGCALDAGVSVSSVLGVCIWLLWQSSEAERVGMDVRWILSWRGVHLTLDFS